MSKEEYSAFKVRVSNDETLKNKTESVQLLLLGIQEALLTEKMENFHSGLSSSKQNKDTRVVKGNFMKRWMLAASVILLMGLGFLIYYTQFNQPQRLYSQFYKPDPGLITSMSTSDNYLFDHAMIDYKTNEYGIAVKEWQELLKSDPTNDTLNYFIGSAFLAEDKSDTAILYFQKVLSNPQSQFLNDANWYTGLALVRQNKSKEAIQFIEKSINPNKEALLLKLRK